MKEKVKEYLIKNDFCIDILKKKDDNILTIKIDFPNRKNKKKKSFTYEYDKDEKLLSVFVNNTVKNIKCDLVEFILIVNTDLYIKCLKMDVDISLLKKSDIEILDSAEKSKVDFYKAEVISNLQKSEKDINKCVYSSLVKDLFECGGIE